MERVRELGVCMLALLLINGISGVYHYGKDPLFCSKKEKYIQASIEEYGDRSPFIDYWIQCRSDGGFESRQCSPNGVCWCVSVFGNRIARTLTPANKEQPICKDLKVGQCPKVAEIPSCEASCFTDADCPSNLKCCQAECGRTCVAPVQECYEDEVTCSDGLTCVHKFQVCDGYPDCPDEDDENEYACVERRFECVRFGRKIPISRRCNGFPDCVDGSDEDDCGEPTQYCDLLYQFICPDGTCFDRNTAVCNGYKDCQDGSDEKNCRMFVCRNGNVISLDSICDFFNDCGDNSDEENCQYPAHCGTDINYPCDNGECISPYYFCDGFPDCSDGSDEHNCPTKHWLDTNQSINKGGKT
ncbi:very low-density lipoprotein receptor-like [Ptychodera flava]|uniref:very low-density lipoprotein receptor-like n=1 Tax=Ptychodera flava TaxID=63121 RepID=UPI00396A742D